MKNGTTPNIKQDKFIRALKTVKSLIISPKLILKYLSRKKYDWSEIELEGIRRKKYTCYAEYVRQQQSKLEEVQKSWLPDYDVKYRVALRERLTEHGFIKSGTNVLCLAARIGTEVKSFMDLGCFAIGIDLNPGEKSMFVVHGDFHDIQFPTDSADIIFSNSLDHAFDMDRLVLEVKRVLKPSGLLILELSSGEEKGYSPGYYESITWRRVDDLLKVFLDSGFAFLKKIHFEYPDPGQHVVLKLNK